MASTLLGISGSLTSGGSTRAIIEYALAAAKARFPEVTTAVLDLREVKISFCDGRPLADYGDDTARTIERIQAADAYIFGSPIYRGSYTGALKNLLDHIPVEALSGKAAGLVGNAASDHHYLSIDQELRPVLMWFNMHLVPGSVYVRGDQMQGKDIVDERIKDHLRQLGEAVVCLHSGLQAGASGPPPLSQWAGRR